MRVHYEDLVETHVQCLVADVIGVPIAKASIKWLFILRKQVTNLLETADFEQVRFLDDNLAIETVRKSVRAKQDGTDRHLVLLLLVNAAEVFACLLCETDWS